MTYEYKTIKVPKSTMVGKWADKKRDKILNRYAAEGWEVDQYKKLGFNFGNSDTVILRREVTTKPKPKREAKPIQDAPSWGEIGREFKAMWKRK